MVSAFWRFGLKAFTLRGPAPRFSPARSGGRPLRPPGKAYRASARGRRAVVWIVPLRSLARAGRVPLRPLRVRRDELDEAALQQPVRTRAEEIPAADALLLEEDAAEVDRLLLAGDDDAAFEE